MGVVDDEEPIAMHALEQTGDARAYVMPLGPLGCEVISNKKTGTRHSWDLPGEPAWNIGVSLKHYRCQNIIAKETRATGHQLTTSSMGSKSSRRL